MDGLVLIAAAALSPPGPAMPSKLWSGVERIVISCTVEDDIAVSRAALCDALATEAKRGAPAAYAFSAGPDQGVETASLSAELSRGGGGTMLLAVTVSRPSPIDDAQGARRGPPTLFRAGPDGAVDARAVAVALDRALPWRAAAKRRGVLDRVRSS